MTRVLVVEDEGIVAAHLQATLERLGYDVPEVAASGQQALALAAELSPDLVLMDIRLQGPLDGIETALRLRDRSDVPLVFLTAHSDDANVSRARCANPYGYLLKPFNERELRSTIEVALYKHQAERALRERERWLDTTLRSIGDGVVATDADGRVVMLNPVAERLTGWPAAEAVGEPVARVFRLVDGRTGEPQEAPAERALRERAVAYLGDHALLVARGGEGRPVEDSAAPIIDDRGRLLGSVLVFRDVGERRELERRLLAASRLSSLGTLAAGVAHEVNNPLTYTLANLEFVRRSLAELRAAGVRGAGASQAVDVDLCDLEAAAADALDGGRRVQRIAADLRSYAQGRDEGDPGDTVVDLASVAQSALRLVAAELRHRVTLRTDFGDAPVVRAPAERLGQVFINLLLNAAQAMPDGRARDNVIALRTYRDERGRAVGEVRDNGRGIAPEHLSRVFDPFFTTKPVGQGMGLGLAICHAVVTACGGEIDVHSAPGEGTTFRLTLPPAAPSVSTLPCPTPSPPTPRRRVIVVDDEPALCAALKRSLGARHDVRTFTCARDALAALAAGDRCDVVVCDLMMPDLNGVEFYRAVGCESPALAARFVFITGGALTPCVRAFLDTTDRPWLAKPLDLGRLEAQIERLAAGATGGEANPS